MEEITSKEGIDDHNYDNNNDEPQDKLEEQFDNDDNIDNEVH